MRASCCSVFQLSRNGWIRPWSFVLEVRTGVLDRWANIPQLLADQSALCRIVCEVPSGAQSSRVSRCCSIDKTSVLALIVHCADISHPAKDWKLHHRWTSSLLEEFFRQVIIVTHEHASSFPTLETLGDIADGQSVFPKARFPLPELTARVNGPSWRVTGFHYPSTRAELTGRGWRPVNSASGNARPSTRPVLTGNGIRSPVNSGR